MRKKILSTLVVLLSMRASAAYAICLPVQGLSFEGVSSDALLIIRDGKNIGLLTVLGRFGSKVDNVRFFTPNICSGSENNAFQVNGNLQRVSSIELFK